MRFFAPEFENLIFCSEVLILMYLSLFALTVQED